MRNDDDRIRKIVEEGFEPVDRLNVEMVCRLVKEQDIRAAEKRLRQENAHLLLVREIRHLLVVLRGLDAKTV